jgi:hypothetical protein
MSYDSLLNNTAMVMRFADGVADVYGNPARLWVPHIVSTPCRQVYGKGREVKVGAEVVIVYDELFVGDIDIIVWDRVIVDSVTYDVISVVQRTDYGDQHHKHCFLQRVDSNG